MCCAMTTFLSWCHDVTQLSLGRAEILYGLPTIQLDVCANFITVTPFLGTTCLNVMLFR